MPARKSAPKNKPTAAKKPAKARSSVKASAGKSKAAPKSKPRATSRPGITGARKAAKVVGRVMTSVKGGKHNEADLFSELGKLAAYIQDARKQIAALRPLEVKEEFLPRASDELDAIVGATADATNAIMDATEIIEDVMSGLDGKPVDKLMTATTAIYEACSFQDITGQRITRVVQTLLEIELKVDGLLAAFDAGGAKVKKSKPAKAKPQNAEITDADLLNGPQDADKASSQADIDALLASFD